MRLVAISAAVVMGIAVLVFLVLVVLWGPPDWASDNTRPSDLFGVPDCCIGQVVND